MFTKSITVYLLLCSVMLFYYCKGQSNNYLIDDWEEYPPKIDDRSALDGNFNWNGPFCVNKTVLRVFCDKVPNYPTAQIAKIFKVTEIKGRTTIDRNIPKTSGRDFRLCAVNKKLWHPKAGIDINDEERLIVNVKGYHQTIDVLECIGTTPTATTASNVTCVQKYMIRKLMTVFQHVNGSIVEKIASFNVPSCCVAEFLPTKN